VILSRCRTRSARHGGRAMEPHHQRWRWSSLARESRFSTAPSNASSDGCAAAATCSPTRVRAEVILIATGASRTGGGAHEQLSSEGKASRSQPAVLGAFDRQDDAYKDEVLAPSSPLGFQSRRHLPGWDGWVGNPGGDDRNEHLRFLRTPEGRSRPSSVHAGQSGRDAQGVLGR